MPLGSIFRANSREEGRQGSELGGIKEKASGFGRILSGIGSKCGGFTLTFIATSSFRPISTILSSN